MENLFFLRLVLDNIMSNGRSGMHAATTPVVRRLSTCLTTRHRLLTAMDIQSLPSTTRILWVWHYCRQLHSMMEALITAARSHSAQEEWIVVSISIGQPMDKI